MSRAEQRQQTEARILAAARQKFADLGYDRTTIRAVAAAAGVDAGLVMHYFKSKDALFAQATDQAVAEAPDTDQAVAEAPATDPPAEALLTSLADRLVSEPAASLAVLRSMLTNPDAADRYRTAAESQLNRIIAGIPAPDADLRASLLSAIVHGVIIERYLLRLSSLADAPPDQIIDLLRPCFEALAATPAD